MPKSFDAEAKKRYTRLIAKGVLPRHACEQLSFTYITVQKHLREDPEFAKAVEAAHDYKVEQVEAVVFDQALQGNFAAVKMFLQNRAGDRWKDETILRKEITGAGGGPIQIVQANVIALREVLTDGTVRDQALEMVRQLPSAAEAIIEAELADE